MKRNPWHKRYHSDALNGYIGLSLEERGAYTTLLDMLYDRGEPIVENDRLIAGYLGVSVRKARSMIAALIDKRKILRTGDGRLTNSRFEKERENELKTSRKHAENGSSGGRARAERAKKGSENSAATVARLEPPSSLNQKPEARSQNIEDAQPFEVPDRASEQSRFREFWAAYPRKEGELQAEAEFITATISVGADVIIEGARAYARSRAGEDPKYTLLAGRWLHQKRWTDQYAASRDDPDPEIANFQRIAAAYGGGRA